MSPFTPQEENKHVKKLLNLLKVEFDTEIIPVQVESYAKPLNCFPNVDEKVKRDGGKAHYGWAIHQTDLLCEAERHAVWESPNEDLIDITPREFVTENTMFVSDNNFIYTGQLVDNVRVNITSNPVVDDFIKVCETLEKFYALGERVDDESMSIPEPIAPYIENLENLKNGYLFFMNSGGTPRKSCFCGSPKAYKNCHGSELKSIIAVDFSRLKKLIARKV